MGAANAAACFITAVLAVSGAPADRVAADSSPVNIPVTRADLNAYQDPWLAADPRDADHLAVAYREGNQRSFCGLAQSRDAGRTWTSEDLVGPAGRLPWPGGFTLCYEAVVAFAPDGTLYYAVQATRRFDDPYSRVLVAVSTDGGIGFSAPASPDAEEPAEQTAAGGDWYPRIAVDGSAGRVFLRWTRYTDRNRSATVVVASTTGRGAAFSHAVTASPAPTSDAFVVNSVGASIAARDGTVYTSWVDATSRSRGCTGAQPQTPAACAQPLPLYVAVSHDAGATFAAPVAVDARLDYGCPGANQPATGRSACDALHYDRGPEEFSVAAGSAPGSAVIAWWDGDPPGPARVSVAATSDSGRTWSAPRTAGALAGHDADQQHRPQLSIAPGGRIDLTYYDVNPQGGQDVYWSRSGDSGASFATPVRISDATSDTGVGPLGEDGVHPGFGEWLGSASTDAAVVVAWTDARRGNRDTAKQDVYVASVQLSTSGGGWWRYLAAAAGGLLLVAAAAVIVLLPRRRRASAA